MKLILYTFILLIFAACAPKAIVQKNIPTNKLKAKELNKKNIPSDLSKKKSSKTRYFHPGLIHLELNDTQEIQTTFLGYFTIDSLSNKTELKMETNAITDTKIRFLFVKNNQNKRVDLGNYQLKDFSSKLIKWKLDSVTNESKTIIYRPISGQIEITRVDFVYEDSYNVFGNFDITYKNARQKDTIRLKGRINKVNYTSFNFGEVKEK
ncbi:MAG: hypothetical protein JEZ01_03250 [Labilibaculum sp.]|nr:hypothetical protein [Labilibaculum sp.]MBI9056769.1 hypothetical protein [Labilibaculum sp.]